MAYEIKWAFCEIVTRLLCYKFKSRRCHIKVAVCIVNLVVKISVGCCLKPTESQKILDNFEWHKSLKLSFKSNSRDILVLCETNLDDSIDSGNFFVRGYIFL